MAFLTDSAIQLAELLAAAQSPERGGVAVFLGLVRNHHDGRPVLRLDYSAYEPMGEAECQRIVAEAATRWDAAIALQHRVGTLAVGDAAVAIVAASAHREAAFAACRFVIDEVKARVPIWKHERYAQGDADWLHPE